jgi:hypothetical protein
VGAVGVGNSTVGGIDGIAGVVGVDGLVTTGVVGLVGEVGDAGIAGATGIVGDGFVTIGVVGAGAGTCWVGAEITGSGFVLGFSVFPPLFDGKPA